MKVTRNLLITLGVTLHAALTMSSVMAATPANSNASTEARAVLDYIVHNVSGSKMLSSVHDQNGEFVVWGVGKDYASGYVTNKTGKYSAIRGNELASLNHSGDFTTYRNNMLQTLVNDAKNYWASGGLTTLTWHQSYPTSPLPEKNEYCWVKNWSGYNETVTPGTTKYNALITDLDRMAGYLKQLRDAKVPILFRPYHEMNGDWFWWGNNPTNYKKLWNIIYNRYTGYHGLNNLIWIWSPWQDSNVETLKSYYPGNDKVDIIGCDSYYGDFPAGDYNAFSNLSTTYGKPIALAEVGKYPSPTIMANQPKWCWAMMWGYYCDDDDTALLNHYNATRTITRDELPGFQASALSRTGWVGYNASHNRSNLSRMWDGNSATFWQTGTPQAAGQFFQIDMGSPQNFKSIVLETSSNAPNDYPRSCEAWVSANAVNWTKVATVTGNNQKTTLSFSNQTARYVMVKQNGAASNWWSVAELNIYR